MSNLKSFADLAAKINAQSKKVQDEVKGIIEFNIGQIEVQAIREAPGPGSAIATEKGSQSLAEIDKGKGTTPISQAIGYTIDSTGYKGTVYVDRAAGNVAAWVEFGTGQSAKTYLATVPPEWKALAQLYYINGKGTIIAQPYLLPAFLKYQIECIKELKEVLGNIEL